MSMIQDYCQHQHRPFLLLFTCNSCGLDIHIRQVIGVVSAGQWNERS